MVGYLTLPVFAPIGGGGRTKQVPNKRSDRHYEPRPRPIWVSSAKCEQPALPHHAGTHHQGPQYETT